MNYSIFTDTMADLDWREIENKGRQKVPVLFPLGVIEEHGPHLPLGTDIYLSYAICKKIKDTVCAQQGDCLIAPPYYWGVNHCTGSFPGTFSLKPETMIVVLTEIFGNLHQFGFDKVYCINQHGDAVHVKTIIDAIKAANKSFDMHIRLLMEPFDLPQQGLSGKEDYILLDEAEYSPELFAEDDINEKTLLDIVYTKYLGSRLDEEEEKKVKEIDDDMLYYDLKILLRGVSEEAPPIMKTHFSYEVLPFEVVEKRYLELFERYSREL